MTGAFVDVVVVVGMVVGIIGLNAFGIFLGGVQTETEKNH